MGQKKRMTFHPRHVIGHQTECSNIDYNKPHVKKLLKMWGPKRWINRLSTKQSLQTMCRWWTTPALLPCLQCAVLTTSSGQQSKSQKPPSAAKYKRRHSHASSGSSWSLWGKTICVLTTASFSMGPRYLAFHRGEPCRAKRWRNVLRQRFRKNCCGEYMRRTWFSGLCVWFGLKISRYRRSIAELGCFVWVHLWAQTKQIRE